MSRLKSTFLLFILYSGLQAQTVHITGPAGSGTFGASVTVLTNGNYVVTDPLYDEGGILDIGAVYLYNGNTHALISTLKGGTASDQIGDHGIIALSNGNFIVLSPNWDNGTATDAGAITWGNGITGKAGVVNSSNSLVGSSAGDNIGKPGITTLANGNFVVSSPQWDNGMATDAGAVTWCNGTMGRTGIINSINSLVGSKAGDKVSSIGITALSNGHYVVSSPFWDNAGLVDAGAVTWGNGTMGVTGAINIGNSLVGGQSNDRIGSKENDRRSSNGVIALSNANYVVSSPDWDNGSITDAGAVTWANGTTGITGAISISNSLVGTYENNKVGSGGITALSNGHYVVSSPFWDSAGLFDAGAATWGNGITGSSGAININNSLIGTDYRDNIGSTGVIALSNGNYVISSPNWNNGSLDDAGAVTWGNGSTGVSGIINSSNSLIGGSAYDRVGRSGITVLKNGNYVVSSGDWNNGPVVDAGAVTWGNGSTGISGIVNSSNSLVGITKGDRLGFLGSVDALNNGNYVVGSSYWHDGSGASPGAVTWCDGTIGRTGTINMSNSLVGSSHGDVGTGVRALSNGNYVVCSPGWDNGAATDAGAITWCNGSTGMSGMVTSSNSLVGSSTDDLVGYGAPIALNNGNYVVLSLDWDNGAATDAGAITLGNGTTGITGVINSSNSLVGSTNGDQVGIPIPLINGSYIVRSRVWDNGTITDAGAITWGSSTTGVSGIITECNSVISTAINGGHTLDFAYNSIYDYVIVNRPADNIITIYISAPVSLANSLDAAAIDITGTGTVPLIVNTGCRIIASLTPNGASPVNGTVNAKAWIESTIPTQSGQPFVARHYEINPATNASTATGRVTIYFTQQEFDDFNAHAASSLNLPASAADVTGIANLRIGKYSGTTNNGTGLPTTYAGTPEVLDPTDTDIVWNSNLNRWEISFDVTGFGGFIIQTSTSVLPLSLLNFSAALNGNDVLVNWKTINRVNAHSFEVERSTDGSHFIKAGELAATNSATEHYYNYTDAGAGTYVGTLYYRLRQINNDGGYNYSQTAWLSISKNSSISLFPNPANQVFTLRISNNVLFNSFATLTDLQGKQVKQFRITDYQSQIDISDLPKGMYILKLIDGSVMKLSKN